MSRPREERRPPRGWLARQTLLTRYLLIVLGAFLFIPIIIPLASILYMTFDSLAGGNRQASDALKYGNAAQVEQAWHAEAAAMQGLSEDAVAERLRELKAKYAEASLFWVDESGQTRLVLPEEPAVSVPDRWTAADAVGFMKRSVNGDPFTVVSFIGGSEAGADFIVLQLPRYLVRAGSPSGAGTPYMLGFILLSVALFAVLSLLFFRHIRKRLLRLQSAMLQQDGHGIPAPVEVRRMDEIGGLEQAFNGMVQQLKSGREREREEEELRKRLIANLSHDLRTPLTVMRGHLYRLQNEPLTANGRSSLAVMEQKADGLSGLIDNLLSYTLMTSGRYALTPAPADVLRLVRESAAAWYPVWEKAGIEADVWLPSEPLIWNVDRDAFRRILDNLLQNIVRHAAEGKHVGLYLEEREGCSAIVVEDRGPGMRRKEAAGRGLPETGAGNRTEEGLESGAGNRSEEGSGSGAEKRTEKGTETEAEKRTSSPSVRGQDLEKGAGIGLAIVDYLTREMAIEWHAESTEGGTRIYLLQRGAGELF